VRPIKTVDDLVGVKIRTGNGRMQLEAFQTFGSQVVSMPIVEVYPSLQTHVVDGQCNPYTLIMSNKFYEVQKYVSDVNLMWASFWVIGNRDAWNALPPDIQAVVNRNAEKYAQLQRRDSPQLAEASADKVVRQGMLRNIADPATFRSKLTPGFFPKWKAEFGARGWAALEEYAGKIS
jgi:TRAP-type C4-dicarboxylate transport system substrate-binding protein